MRSSLSDATGSQPGGPAKVCPFCYAQVPLEADVCPRCQADLVEYRPGRGPVRDQAKNKAFRALLIIFGAIFAFAAALGVYYPLVDRGAFTPAYTETGWAAGTHFIVVTPQEAARDNDLWSIASRIRGSDPRVHLMFWTNAEDAPTTAPPTDVQRREMAAEIVVDPTNGVRELKRPDR